MANPNYPQSPWISQHPTGPVTKWLCVTTVLVSLFGTMLQRTHQIGTNYLLFSVEKVLDFEIWRILTYFFVERSPFGLILAVFVLWIFGKDFEKKWGSRDFLRFVLLSSMGAALLAIPLSWFINILMPFKDFEIAEGPWACIDALLVALVLRAPKSNILLGFVIPMPAKTVLYVLIGFHLISGIMTGTTGLAIILGGMIMGYILTTGNWRPRRLLAQLQLWKYRRRRRGIHIVPPKNGPTLH